MRKGFRKTRLSNYDNIRKLTLEEMTQYFYYTQYCPSCKPKCEEEDGIDCMNCIENWLKAPMNSKGWNNASPKTDTQKA